MATFFIQQFGCRATQADAAAIERQLCDRGYSIAVDQATADVVVVNTCTVTASADLQARQAIHAIHRANPNTQIVVTGCYAQRAPEDLAGLDGVLWVVGNSHKPEIPRLVQEMTPLSARPVRDGEGFVAAASLTNALSLDRGPAKILSGSMLEQREILVAPLEGHEGQHTRPVLKIQDGCDSRCSYCVIPLVRGRSRSLPPDRVLEEIRQLSSHGAREVVLSGIDLGNYGRDLSPRADLGMVIRRIVDETSIERLRVSSIEPMDVTEDLVGLFVASSRLAPHFHMPLQSGSDRILAAMRRWYRAEHYARRAEVVRAWLPQAAIGADVIAGFPGETEEDHRATLDMIEAMPITYLHVFSFSARPGTPAATLSNPVPHADTVRRASELRAVGERKKSAFLRAQIGREMRVLTLNRVGEDASGPWTRALSGNYLDVRVPGHVAANRFLNIRVTEVRGTHLTASVV